MSHVVNSYVYFVGNYFFDQIVILNNFYPQNLSKLPFFLSSGGQWQNLMYLSAANDFYYNLTNFQNNG